MGSFLDKPVTEKETLAGEGNGLIWACSAMQGWRVDMEVGIPPPPPPHTHTHTPSGERAVVPGVRCPVSRMTVMVPTNRCIKALPVVVVVMVVIGSEGW